MDILPQQIKGKIVSDFYQAPNGNFIIEFTDGTKLIIQEQGFISPYSEKLFIDLQP